MRVSRMDRTDIYLVVVAGVVTWGLLTLWGHYEKPFLDAYEEWMVGRDDR